MLQKLLEADRQTLSLMRHDPFPERPPKFIRASYYRYEFMSGEERRDTHAWWNRTRIGEYFPGVTADALNNALQH